MSRFYLNNTYYFLTCPTINHEPLFNTDEKKHFILNQIKKVEQRYSIPYYAFGVISYHYHSMFYFENGKDVGKVTQLINGGSSFQLNKHTGINRRVWDDYFLVAITNKEMFYKILGYTIGNLLKHNEVKDFKELKESPFSSYGQTAKLYGDEFAKDLVRSVIDINLESANNIKKATSVLENIKITLPKAH